MPVAAGGRGLAPAAALRALAGAGIGALLLEGGAALATEFLAADLVDELVVARAPLVVGTSGIEAPALLLADLPESGWRRVAFHEMGGDTITVHERLREKD
jgi:diaminohydroxyphosphoribosylaminopyrimidine deaminase/5-amino-6-(5-phosphoribosylamino)uracil reductase